jgi:hypothetical protein
METESNNFTTESKIIEVFNSNKNHKVEKKKMETDSLTVEYFNKTVKVLDNGRYQVSLPLNQTLFPPANTFQVALKRLYKTERSFDKDTIKAEKYRTFVNKFIQSGFMSEVKEDLFKETYEGHYYLPHHAVYKINDPSGKI